MTIANFADNGRFSENLENNCKIKVSDQNKYTFCVVNSIEEFI